MKQPSRTPLQSWVINFVLFLATTVLTLVGVEMVLRFLGYQPWQVKEVKIEVEPGGKFFTQQPALGYSHLAGAFEVTLPDGYTFKVTHLENTLRITHLLDSYSIPAEKDEIWIFGCSFTHGWTLNDAETYPWLLQQRFPQYEVVNFGVSGYGTLQSYLQFQEALETERRPKLIIIAYASFHDQRNTLLRLRSKQMAPWNKLGPIVQPYAWLTPTGDLRNDMAELTYREFPLMRYSALAHLIETTYNHKVENHFYQSHEVSKAIIKAFAEAAEAKNIPLLVAGLLSDPLTTDTLTYAREQGIITADISVDLSLPGNRNLPHDPHPSAAANAEYAQNLAAFLRDIMSKSTVSQPQEKEIRNKK